jgi:hypothetical protein
MKKAFIVALENNKKILKQFVDNMTQEEINRRIKDYWTIYEHIDHLVETQISILGRIQSFINKEKPVIEPYIPDDHPVVKYPNKSASDLLSEFIELRDKQIKLIEKTKKSVWEKQGSHEEYNEYTFEILVRHIIIHDGYHMFRMEELWIMKDKYIKELK